MRPRVGIAIAALLTACTQARLTEVLIVVDTDLAVPAELERVRFEVTGPRGDVQEAAADFAAGEARPAVLAMVYRGGPLGPFAVEVTGERGAEAIVRRDARFEFVPGSVRALRLWLSAECVGVECGAGETCEVGQCRAIEVDPGELVPWNGAPSTDGGVDGCGGCDDGLDCTVDVCREDGCAHLADARLCADDGLACTITRCDVERGCVHEPDDSACDDDVECTEDRCDREQGCVSSPDDDECRDGVRCTDDRCDPADGCVFTPDDSECDDGIACTVERCDPEGGCESSVSHAACALGERCDEEDGCERGPTFTEVYAFFDRRCTGWCHTADDPDGGLDLSTRAAAWAGLVGAASTCDSSARVVPRDARGSLLWRKVARSGLCGERMPPSGPPTGEDDVRLIERWIAAGALDD